MAVCCPYLQIFFILGIRMSHIKINNYQIIRYLSLAYIKKVFFLIFLPAAT